MGEFWILKFRSTDNICEATVYPIGNNNYIGIVATGDQERLILVNIAVVEKNLSIKNLKATVFSMQSNTILEDFQLVQDENNSRGCEDPDSILEKYYGSSRKFDAATWTFHGCTFMIEVQREPYVFSSMGESAAFVVKVEDKAKIIRTRGNCADPMISMVYQGITSGMFPSLRELQIYLSTQQYAINAKEALTEKKK